MYTKEQVEKGLELAAHWYEGWKVDEIHADQLIECIEKSIVTDGD